MDGTYNSLYGEVSNLLAVTPMLNVLSISKALADENRLRALLALRERELCLCQLIELLELAPSTVSRHISILRQANLVQARKEGRWMHYRHQSNPKYIEALKALSWVCESLAESPRIHGDAQRLENILMIQPEQLCRQQSAK